MARLLIILILTFTFVKMNGQTSNRCNCEALINTDYKGEIIVYDNPNGKPIKKLKNDLEEENYLVLTIDNDSLGFFHVDISYTMTESSNVVGWVRKSKAIGTFTSNYSQKDTLYLYSEPDIKSIVRSSIPEWTNQLYIIKKCFEKWVYVQIDYKGQLKEGWLPSDRQCANPYTTCN